LNNSLFDWRPMIPEYSSSYTAMRQPLLVRIYFCRSTGYQSLYL